MKTFESPREEALELAREARKKIIFSEFDAVSALRACLVIAQCLNKTEKEAWISDELFGYPSGSDLPEYRNVYCKRKKIDGSNEKYDNCPIYRETSYILHCLKNNKDINFDSGTYRYHVLPRHFNVILSTIIDNCLMFLNEVVTELQYGGIVEGLMENIRKDTDAKLVTLDEKLANESNSLYLNLASTNPADWNKVGHSSRKMLKILADVVFPPISDKYKMKDGREIQAGDAQFINRLCAYLDTQIDDNEERRFLLSEISYFETYLRRVTKYAQMNEHAESIEKYHADMLAIHTYLIISAILKHHE